MRSVSTLPSRTPWQGHAHQRSSTLLAVSSPPPRLRDGAARAAVHTPPHRARTARSRPDIGRIWGHIVETPRQGSPFIANPRTPRPPDSSQSRPRAAPGAADSQPCRRRSFNSAHAHGVCHVQHTLPLLFAFSFQNSSCVPVKQRPRLAFLSVSPMPGAPRVTGLTGRTPARSLCGDCGVGFDVPRLDLLTTSDPHRSRWWRSLTTMQRSTASSRRPPPPSGRAGSATKNTAKAHRTRTSTGRGPRRTEDLLHCLSTWPAPRAAAGCAGTRSTLVTPRAACARCRRRPRNGLGGAGTPVAEVRPRRGPVRRIRPRRPRRALPMANHVSKIQAYALPRYLESTISPTMVRLG